jgi:hypothetical protein
MQKPRIRFLKSFINTIQSNRWQHAYTHTLHLALSLYLSSPPDFHAATSTQVSTYRLHFTLPTQHKSHILKELLLQIIYTCSPHTTNKQSTQLPTFFPSGGFQGFNNIIPPMKFETSKKLLKIHKRNIV